MLNYVFDPTIVNPVSARVGQPGDGRHHVRRRQRRPGPAVEVRQEQLPVPRRHGLSINDKTVFRAGWGKYFLNPTSQAFNNGFSQSHADHRVERRQPHADLRCWRTRGRTASRRLRAARSARSRSSAAVRASRTRTSSSRTCTSSRPASSASCRGKISLEVTYAGSRSYDIEGNFGGYNEPSAAFQAQCDVTLGGSRSLCDQLLPNPFFGVARLRGHDPVHEPDALALRAGAAVPGVHRLQPRTSRTSGKMRYDSMQFVANKRWAKGVTINASYTWVPRWTEDGANTTTRHQRRLRRRGLAAARTTAPYFSQRKHRLTASGVWELPWYRNERSLAGYLLGGWSIAPAFVFQSRPALGYARQRRSGAGRRSRRRSRCPGKKDGQFIYGVKPCVGQRNATTGNYALLSVSTAYGCTRALLPDPRGVPAPHRDVPLRRVPPAVLLAGGHELREDHADHGHVRFQVRLEAFNLFNSPMYDERNYNQTTTSADFGRINRNITGQSNFQRFVQLGFRLIF